MNRDISSGPGTGSGGMDPSVRAQFMKKLENDRLKAQEEAASKGPDNEASAHELASVTTTVQDSAINSPVKTATPNPVKAQQPQVENRRSFTILGMTFELPRSIPSFSPLGNIFSQALRDIGATFSSTVSRSNVPATDREAPSFCKQFSKQFMSEVGVKVLSPDEREEIVKNLSNDFHHANAAEKKEILKYFLDSVGDKKIISLDTFRAFIKVNKPESTEIFKTIVKDNFVNGKVNGISFITTENGFKPTDLKDMLLDASKDGLFKQINGKDNPLLLLLREKLDSRDLAHIPSQTPVLQKIDGNLHQNAANIFREQITQDAIFIPESEMPDLEPIVEQEVPVVQQEAVVELSEAERAQKSLALVTTEVFTTEHSHTVGLRDLKLALNTFLVTTEPPHQTINIEWKIPPSKDEPFGLQKLQFELIQYIETYEKAYNAAQKFEDKIQEKIYERGGDAEKLTTDDLLEVYNDAEIFSNYVETMKECAAIKTRLDNLILRVDFAKTFKLTQKMEDQMIGEGGRINILKNKTVFPVQRLPRHVLLLQEIVKTTNKANDRHPDEIDEGPLGQTLLMVKNRTKYMNVESSILSDRATLEDVRRSLDKFIETDHKLSKQSSLKSLQPIPRRIFRRQDINKTPDEIKKILNDITTISNSNDPQISKFSRNLLNMLEDSHTAMETIRDDEALMKSYRELSSNTFKDIESLYFLLDRKQGDSSKSLSLDENENVTLKDITGTKPEETQRAVKKAEEVLASASVKIQKSLEEIDRELALVEKNSVDENRLLDKKSQLNQIIEKSQKVDKFLGVSDRKENAIVLDKLRKAIDLLEGHRKIRIHGENGTSHLSIINPINPENVEAMSFEDVINQLEILLKSKDDVTKRDANEVLKNLQTYAFNNIENINWNPTGNYRYRTNMFETPLYLRFLSLGD